MIRGAVFHLTTTGSMASTPAPTRARAGARAGIKQRIREGDTSVD
jgi:hypothetical protein